MQPIASQCSEELLRLLLADALTEIQEEQIAMHLNGCKTCRSRLEHLAADDAAWHQISAVLRLEHANSLSDSAGEFVKPLQPPEQFPADFAVDFLSPSDQVDSIGRLADIEIKSVIGHGGNGIVLKGFQPELNRLVAVKVMAPHLAASAAARQRFAREAQATAAIVHPAVMPILSVNSTGQLPFLIMPCVDCESLQQRIDRVGGLSVVDVLRIGLQVARGLQAAHAQGLVHRDVKPANILLERGVERVMLTDFGLARAVDDASLTRTGLIAGTPQYMSPEQARGDAVDPRSDLFSLGSVLYVMATGRPPFRAETSYGILRRVTDETPRAVRELNPEVPEWLCAIILRLLEKSAADRFQTAEAVAELLEDCLAHVQQPAAIPLPITARSLVKSSGPLSQWRLWLATIGGGLLLVLIAYQTATLVEGPSNDFQAEYGTDSQTAVDRNSLASGKLLTPIPSSSGSGVSATGQSAGFSAGSSHDLPDDPSFDIEQLHEEIDQLLEDTSELP